MNTNNDKGSETCKDEIRYKQLQDYATEVNWRKLVELFAHHYVESGIGRLQVPIESMIRVYFLQLRYNLNASEASLALSKIDILKDFALIDQKRDVIPEEESIDTFRSLIELKGLADRFATAFDIQPIRKLNKAI